MGGSWQLHLQKAGGILNGIRISWGNKTKNLNVNNIGTVFFKRQSSTLLHLCNTFGDHGSLTLMEEHPQKLFVLEALFDFSLC